MGFKSWGDLADRLQFERKKRQMPTCVELDNALKQSNLNMQVWNEVREVADSGIALFRQGKDLDAKLVLQLVRDGLLPRDLVHTRGSLERMLQFVDEIDHFRLLCKIQAAMWLPHDFLNFATDACNVHSAKLLSVDIQSNLTNLNSSSRSACRSHRAIQGKAVRVNLPLISLCL